MKFLIINEGSERESKPDENSGFFSLLGLDLVDCRNRTKP